MYHLAQIFIHKLVAANRTAKNELAAANYEDIIPIAGRFVNSFLEYFVKCAARGEDWVAARIRNPCLRYASRGIAGHTLIT